MTLQDAKDITQIVAPWLTLIITALGLIWVRAIRIDVNSKMDKYVDAMQAEVGAKIELARLNAVAAAAQSALDHVKKQ
jgi:hypothetical protein